MIHPSQFLRRALLADAVFSGIAAMVLTLDAGALAPLWRRCSPFRRRCCARPACS